MSVRVGNSPGEKRRKKAYSAALTSSLKRRKLAKVVKPMTEREERQAIEAYINKNGVTKIILEPPAPTPVPKSLRTHKWVEIEDDARLRDLVRRRFSMTEAAQEMGWTRWTVQHHAKRLDLHFKGKPGRPRKVTA